MKNVLKKICAVALLAVCVCFSFAACGGNDASAENASVGTVATDGSTSMEKVIGSLGEAYMMQNPKKMIFMIKRWMSMSFAVISVWCFKNPILSP